MTIIEYFMSDALIQAIGQSMLHSLWQGLLIVGLLSLSWHYLKGASAATRYGVGILGLFLFSGMVLATFIGIYNNLSASEVIAGMGPGESFYELANPFAAAIGETEGGMNFPTVFFPFLVISWLAGVGMMSIRLVLELVYIQRLQINASPISGQWMDHMQTYADRLGIRRVVRLMESDWVTSPLTVGVIQPVILMPIGLVNGLTTDQVACILAHELAHIQRYDFAVNILQSIVEVALFFNPAVWWISKNIREERELCCDDVAVGLTKNKHQLAYTLAKLEEWRLETPSLAMSFNAPESKVIARIQRLIGEEPKANVLTKGWLSILLITAFFVLAAFRTSPILERQVGAAMANPADAEMDARPVLAERVAAAESILAAQALADENRARSSSPAIFQIAQDTIPPEALKALRKKEQALIEQMEALAREMENSPERQEMEKLMREFETAHRKFEEEWQGENEGLEKEMERIERKLSEEMREKEKALMESPDMKKFEEIHKAFEKKAEAIAREIETRGDLKNNEALHMELQKKMEDLHREFQLQQGDLELKLQTQMKALNEVHERFMQSDEMKKLQEVREKQQEAFQKLNSETNQKTQARMQELQEKLQRDYHDKMQKLQIELHEISKQLGDQRQYREE
ncbi:MAG: M56 family metallopeptidase [Saprospiraceae bacterium]